MVRKWPCVHVFLYYLMNEPSKRRAGAIRQRVTDISNYSNLVQNTLGWCLKTMLLFIKGPSVTNVGKTKNAENDSPQPKFPALFLPNGITLSNRLLLVSYSSNVSAVTLTQLCPPATQCFQLLLSCL